MNAYTLSTAVREPYETTVDAVREALGEQGFGILTEIDLRATLAEKLGVDVAPQVILGACRPPLARTALEVEPSIGTMLPCNVTVRSVDDRTTVVEAFDPDAMTGLTDNHALASVASEAKRRLTAALAALTEESG